MQKETIRTVGSRYMEDVRLSMRWLQTRLIGPVPSSFSIHSHSYERSKQLTSVLDLPSFRFSPYNPTASSNRDRFLWKAAKKTNQKKRLLLREAFLSQSGLPLVTVW